MAAVAVAVPTVGQLTAGADGAAAGAAPVAPASVGFSPGANIITASDADLARELDVMAATGAGWLRLDFPWPTVQPTPTTWNWAPFDRVVQAASARGLQILALPSYTPRWAMAPGSPENAPPADPAAFATFVSQLVKRYQPAGIRHWEIWNEPNGIWTWSPPDPAGYARLLVAASLAITVCSNSERWARS